MSTSEFTDDGSRDGGRNDGSKASSEPRYFFELPEYFDIEGLKDQEVVEARRRAHVLLSEHVALADVLSAKTSAEATASWWVGKMFERTVEDLGLKNTGEHMSAGSMSFVTRGFLEFLERVPEVHGSIKTYVEQGILAGDTVNLNTDKGSIDQFRPLIKLQLQPGLAAIMPGKTSSSTRQDDLFGTAPDWPHLQIQYWPVLVDDRPENKMRPL